MATQKVNFTIQQGADFVRRLTWKDSRGKAINLTGYTAKLQIRDVPNGVIYIELSTADSRITLGGTAGTILMKLTAAQTQALAITSKGAVYDLLLTASTGEVIRLIEGRITFSPTVTVP